MLEIRKAMKSRDADYLCQMDRKSHNPFPIDRWERIIANQRDGDYWVLIATDFDMPVGGLVAYVDGLRVAIYKWVTTIQSSIVLPKLIDTLKNLTPGYQIEMVIDESLVYEDKGKVGYFMNQLGFKAVTPLVQRPEENEPGIRFVLGGA